MWLHMVVLVLLLLLSDVVDIVFASEIDSSPLWMKSMYAQASIGTFVFPPNETAKSGSEWTISPCVYNSSILHFLSLLSLLLLLSSRRSNWRPSCVSWLDTRYPSCLGTSWTLDCSPTTPLSFITWRSKRMSKTLMTKTNSQSLDSHLMYIVSNHRLQLFNPWILSSCSCCPSAVAA